MASRLLPLAVLCALALAAPAQALYEQVTFVPILADAADYPGDGFLDYREVAIGEPGDGTLVFRLSVKDITDHKVPLGVEELDVWLTVPDGGKRLTMFSDLRVAGGYDSCSIDGGFAYCIAKYATLNTAVGETIGSTYAVSYSGYAQDYGPGTLFTEEHAKATAANPLNPVAAYPKGSNYTITGSTVGGAGGGGPVHQNVTTASFKLAITQAAPLNGTYTYGWESSYGAVDLAHDIKVTGGSVRVKATAPNGAVALDKSLTADDKGAKLVTPAKGRWTVEVTYQGFKGTLGLDITEHKEGSTTSQGPTSGPTTTGGGTTKPATAFGFIYVVAGLAVALARRRVMG
jgi:hypothetical protein